MVAVAFKAIQGADDKRLDAILATTEASLKRQLGEGFGDHGWFAEGTACGRISSNGILPLIGSLKVAAGKDYISPRPAGRYTVLRLMHEIVRLDNQPEVPARGDYGDDRIWQWKHSISFEGDFAVGMGAVLPDEARAMAWIYDHFGEPGEKKDWDSDYPHQAIYAFVNWPEKTLEPHKVLPKVIVDTVIGASPLLTSHSVSTSASSSSLTNRPPPACAMRKRSLRRTKLGGRRGRADRRLLGSRA